MKKFILLLIFANALLLSTNIAQTNPVAQSLPLNENFNGMGNGTVLPAGFATWLNGYESSKALAESSMPSGDAAITARSTTTTGSGVYNYYSPAVAPTNSRLYIQVTANASNGSCQIVGAINTANLRDISVSYDVEMINQQASRVSGMSLQYRAGISGSWTTVAGTDYSGGALTDGTITHFAVTLPSGAENQPVVQLRWITYEVGSVSGSRDGLGLDNVVISGSSPVTTIAQLTNGIATSPLTGGQPHEAVIGFSLTSNVNGFSNFTAINVQTSSTTLGKFNNIELYKSTDNDFSTPGDNTEISGVSVVQSATELQLSGLTEALSTTAANYFVVVDIDLIVTVVTASVQPFFDQSNINVSAGTITNNTITGTNYSFHPPAILLANMEGGVLAYTEDDAATVITANATVAAVAANLQSGVIQITGNYQNGEDALGFSTKNGISGSWDAATGTLTLSGTTTVANYQTAIRSITYQNISQNPGTLQRTVSFTLNDGTDNSNTVTRSITIMAVNDTPALAGIEGADLDYTERDPAKQITGSITISDADNSSMSSATVQVTVNYTSGEDVLSFTNQNGITATWIAGTGTLSLSGVTTNANYQTALRSITYQNTSPNPNTLLRTVCFTISDGAVNSTVVTRNINVIAVNNPPTLTLLETTALVYPAGNPAVAITQTISLNDLDNLNMASAEVKITGHYQNGNDVLSFTNPGAGGITGTWDASTGTMTLNGAASFTNYQTALRSVNYQHVEGAIPDKYMRTIVFKVNDGTADGNIVSREVNLGNTAPILTGIESDTLEYKQGDTPKIITNGITITDDGIPNLQYAMVRFSSNYKNREDVLSFTNQNGIIGTWYPSQGVLVLSLSSTLENYEAALRSVTYHNISDSPSTLPRTINFKVGDVYLESDEVSRSVNITPIFTVTLTNEPNNGGVTTGAGIFDPGTSVTVTATPNTGYTFVNWTEGGTEVSTNAGYTFTINSNRTLTANFALIQCTVTTSLIPPDGGTTTGGGTYDYGTSVTVTAAPNDGYSFVNWTSGGTVVSTSQDYTFAVSGTHNLVANFMMLPILTVTPDFFSVGPVAGTESFNVSNAGGGTMNWAAVSDIFWVKIKSGASGTNNGIINLTYDHNNSASRVGTITITATGVKGSPKIVEIRQGEPVTFVENLNLGIPDNFRLEQNYPNPFNPSTKIRYGLPKESNVVLTIYNVLGEEVAKLVNNVQSAGYYEANFATTNLSSGIYVYRISAGNFTQIRKMLLIK